MTHVRTSPFYPQSNGKLERLTKSLKGECIRPNSPVSLSDARCLVATYVEHYNTVRLHSAIGYVTPQAKLEGREGAIFAERQCRLAQARAARLIWPIGPSTRAWPYETGPDEHTAHRAAQLQGNPLDLAHSAGQAGVPKISSLTGGGCPVLITLCS
jgi:integrase-like protein